MKKTIFLNLIFTFALLINVQAQVKRTAQTVTSQKRTSTQTLTKKLNTNSKWEVGLNIDGEFNANSGSNNNTKFGVNAMAGYRVTPEILVGAKLGTAFQKDVSEIIIGGFGRYYYEDYFGGAGINHSSSSVKIPAVSPFASYTTTYGVTFATLEGGYRIKTTDNIAIETSANYNFTISPAGGSSWFGVKVGGVYSF